MDKKSSIYNRLVVLWVAIVTGFLGVSCSSRKFIPQGSHLLKSVELESADKNINTSQLKGYVKQQPNTRWFGAIKVPLGIYAMSGRKDNKVNRALKKMGEEPVVYSPMMSERSVVELRHALQNMGYLGAQVTVEESYKRHKVSLAYQLYPGEMYRVDEVKWDVKDSVIEQMLEECPEPSLLKPDMAFDINILDKERKRIVDYLKNNGYYKFNKEHITYSADTVQGSKKVGLTLHLSLFQKDRETPPALHRQYTLDSVIVITEFNTENIRRYNSADFNHLAYKGLDVYYRDSKIFRPSVFRENTFLNGGELYNTEDVNNTYNSMGQLGALKYTNILFEEQPDTNRLNAFMLVAPSRFHSLTFEGEGTNTAGDFGMAASVIYQHKNLFRGSEVFTMKMRVAYENAFDEVLSGYDSNKYFEYSFDGTLNFPRLMPPFLSSLFKEKVRASSEVGLQYSMQERPEFSRRVVSASWRYRWNTSQHSQHRVDLPDINYVYMPSISKTFRDEYLNNAAYNSILKYNYEDLLICRAGYTYSYTSAGNGGNLMQNNLRNTFSIRTNFEMGGNLLYLISNLTDGKRMSNGQYAVGNIAYAQYVKGDLNYTKNVVLDKRNSLSFHFALGVAYPYGNSTILPFEKRYFSGGANSVRGWSVRALGPGSFSGGDDKIDFINQTGDMKLDLSVEYRISMSGIFKGAVFVAAGNIWTLREYDEQPGGAFHFDTFLSDMAVAYGLGLRMEIAICVLRLDMGMKAVNPKYPSNDRRHYPILRPNLRRDAALHFAVGYPF